MFIIIIIIIIIIIVITFSHFESLCVTFKLEDIHRPKFCVTTFFICHYTDIGNGECHLELDYLHVFKNKFQLLHLVYVTYVMDINST